MVTTSRADLDEIPDGTSPLDDLPDLPREVAAGRLLTRVVLAAASWVLLGSAACAVLALAGLWVPVVAGSALLVLAALAWRLTRAVPVVPMPVWSLLALLAVVLAATVWTGATHSEQVLPRRDSGSYLQSAIDLAEHGRRPIDVDVERLGGAEVLRIDGITLSSPAFYQVGPPADPKVQPQFVVGPSAWWSVAWWLGGAEAAFWAPALAGGLGLLAIGLLTAVAVGPRWAALAALGVAVCFPVVHTSRSTYSEPLATFTLAAGLAALALALRAAAGSTAYSGRVVAPRSGVLSARAVPSTAFLAGALVGGTALVRIDALREALLLIPVAALAAGRVARSGAAGAEGRVVARPLLVGAAAATAVAGVAAGILANQYLGTIWRSLVPLAALGVVVAVGCWALVRRERTVRRALGRVGPRLPWVAAALVIVVGLVLASRPLWMVVRQSAADPGARVVAGLQLAQGLPVDGGRTYAEATVVWLAWWVGPVALVIALGALAAAIGRVVGAWQADEALPGWSGPLLVAAGSSLLTLWRPGITPDHPWADRRLLVVLPFVVVLVVGATAVATRLAMRRLPWVLVVWVPAVLGLSLVVPTALATAPHATERVELGELRAVRQVCGELGPQDVVLVVDARGTNEWPQVLRGLCGVPSLSTRHELRQDPARLRAVTGQVAAAVAARGGRLVLLGADGEEGLRDAGAVEVLQVVDSVVDEDARLLERRPDGLVPLAVRVWLGTP